jgi:hypothetical protein
MTTMIKLHGGAEVTVDEFITWHPLKQRWSVVGHHQKGVKCSPEHVAKVKAAVISSPGHQAHQKRQKTPEYRQQMSERLKNSEAARVARLKSREQAEATKRADYEQRNYFGPR